MVIKQGDIFWVDLEQAKGTEEQKKRPCVIISNDEYNATFNTVIVAPISSASKYLTETKYQKSPFFETVDCNHVHGTILLQHIRALDIHARSDLRSIGHLPQTKLTKILSVIHYEF